jgi:hypothetical protein
VSCEDHPKSNWVVDYNVLSTHFLVVYILKKYKGMHMGVNGFIYLKK